MVFGEMQGPDRHRVNAAKSVDTASSFALNAKYSAGRYCAALVSNSASTARSLARSSVSTSTRCKLAMVQASSGTGGTASSTLCGAQASGGLNWNVIAVVSRRLGTTSI